MKLRDLFRRRTDAPDPPVPAPARRPDWPAMRPVQRVVSSPDLIIAPDRFTDGLVSWRNPSQGSTLGHYVTPDAPAGVSDGLAAASPRGELPAPAQPWWWPRPPAVQRRVPTSTPAPEPVSSTDPAPTPPPAVPVYPLTGHTLVSAAGVEPPPRLALPAVQRHAAEPEASQAPIADPDVPAGESPPEAPLPSAVAARTEPLPEASAGSAVSWPGSRPDLPVTRRFGLGAPLQRVPDTGGGASVDTSPHPDPGPVWSPSAEPTTATAATPTGAEPSPVQRQIETEAGAEPTDVAPLVSNTPPMASVVIPSTAVPSAEPAAGSRSTGPSPSPQSVQRAVDTPLQPGPGPMRSPSPELTTATAATPTGAEPSPVQRQIETEAGVEPTDVAPLVSNTSPMASVVIPPTAVPSAEPAAGSRSPGPSPSPQSVQRAVDTPREPGPGPVESPSPGPIAVTPLPAAAAPTKDGSPTAQRQTDTEGDAEPLDVAPLVSGSPPIASVAVSPTPSGPVMTPPLASPLAATLAAGSGSAEPGPSAGSPSRSTVPSLAVQRAVDTSPEPEPSPVESPSTEPTAVTPLLTTPAPTKDEPPTAQRQTDAEGDAEPRDVAPLVSGSPPIASVAVSPTPSGPVVTPPLASPLVATPSAKPGSAEPGPSTGSPSRSTLPGLAVQRAVDTSLAPEPDPVESPSPGPTAVTPLPTTPAPTKDESPTAQRRIEVDGEPMEVAPLVSGSSPMASVGTPSTAPVAGPGSAEPGPSTGSRSTWPGLAVQRAVDTPLQPEPRPVWSPSAEVAAATPLPTAAAPTGAGPSTVQRQVQVEGEPMDVAPLVSGSPPMASVVIPSTSSRSAGPSPSAGSSTRSSEPSLPVQRAVDTLLQRESADMPTPPVAAPAPLFDMDHAGTRRTVTYDSVAPPVLGLVGDRPLEPVVTDYAAAPTAEQTRRPAVQRRSTAEGQVRAAQVSGPRMLATTVVQRSTGAGANPAAQWPPDARAVSRSSPGVSQQEPPAQPVQFVQFAAAAPVAAESNPPELSTTLLVQRADDEPAAATDPPTATDPSTATAGTTPAPPAGSTSPTEVDTLVRRLYDPIVRRLKAELQLDRERAGHSLDLRH